jgi:hypothetical protein
MKRKADGLNESTLMHVKKKIHIDPEAMLEYQYSGLDHFERAIGYCFRNKWLVIQLICKMVGGQDPWLVFKCLYNITYNTYMIKNFI